MPEKGQLSATVNRRPGVRCSFCHVGSVAPNPGAFLRAGEPCGSIQEVFSSLPGTFMAGFFLRNLSISNFLTEPIRERNPDPTRLNFFKAGKSLKQGEGFPLSPFLQCFQAFRPGACSFTQQVDHAKDGTLLSLTIPWVPHPLRPTDRPSLPP